MNSHTRIQCTANITAIQQLDCSSYKILMYLACRSNQYGTCFPYGVTIAKDTGIEQKTVYSKLNELVTYGYIKYLRNAHHNRFTNESTPPLFQVSQPSNINPHVYGFSQVGHRHTFAVSFTVHIVFHQHIGVCT